MQSETQQEALSRARTGQSNSNYPAIFSGFIDKGIPETEIRPRENVFTFHAWKALGRSVKKGEHGVRVVSYIPVYGDDDDTGERQVIGSRPKSTTVFHITQTQETPARQ